MIEAFSQMLLQMPWLGNFYLDQNDKIIIFDCRFSLLWNYDNKNFLTYRLTVLITRLKQICRTTDFNVISRIGLLSIIENELITFLTKFLRKFKVDDKTFIVIYDFFGDASRRNS